MGNQPKTENKQTEREASRVTLISVVSAVLGVFCLLAVPYWAFIDPYIEFPEWGLTGRNSIGEVLSFVTFASMLLSWFVYKKAHRTLGLVGLIGSIPTFLLMVWYFLSMG